jgi:putative phosphoesterase
MKYIIASDIHGNLEYMEKLDKFISFEQDDLDGLILLGDLLNNYHYYNPEEISKVAALLNKHAKIITCVKGNGDSYSDSELLLFDPSGEYLNMNIDGIDFLIMHGHLLSKYEYLLNDHYAFLGHTHEYNLEGKHFNPGSVGFPRHGLEHTCILYKNRKLYLINLDNYGIIEEKIV